MDAGLIAVLVAPHVPGITAAGKAAAEELVRKAVDSGWDRGAEIWKRLHPKVEESAKAKVAVEDVAADPADGAAQGVLAKRIKEILEADPAMAAEIEALLPAAAMQANKAIASGAGSVAIGGNAHGARIATGGSIVFDRDK